MNSIINNQREREREREKSSTDINLELESQINRKSHYKELVNTMPYNDKILWAKKRIKELLIHVEKELNEKEIIISFSGGKDSTVLLDLVVKVHKEINSNIFLIPAYALEITFPETISFIKEIVDKYRKQYKFLKELHLEKPKLAWLDILQQKGYPIFSKQVSVILNRIKKAKSKNGLSSWVFGTDTSRFKISKDRLFLLDNKLKIWPQIHKDYFNFLNNTEYIYSEKCCNYIKNGLKHIKKPVFVGTMISESEFRKNSWIKYGCNVINNKHILSRPLSLFTNKDVWLYIWKNELKVNPKYNYKKDKDLDTSINDLKYQRLGCISCPYGSHLEKDKNRFEILYDESKALYESHVIKNGMYKILIDMKIKIKQDKKYMELFYLRWNQINKWYESLEENLADIITQIENKDNYKNLKPSKNKQVSWFYKNEEIYEFFNNYKLETTHKQIDKLISKYRKIRQKGD